jgi:hypothetical protein
MKISIPCAIALALSETSSAFTPPPRLHRPSPIHFANSRDEFQRHSSTFLAAQNNDSDDLSEFLGDNNSFQAGLAFSNIVGDNMAGLQQLLREGLNPDTRFFLGNTILHLIALKGKEQSLDDDKYRNVLAQLLLSGGNVQAKNDAGFTPLEFLKGEKNKVFAENIKQVQGKIPKPPLKQSMIDSQLATFSLQTKPSHNGKRLIIELIKTGANPEYKTVNGKTIVENVESNWSRSNAQAFKQLVIAAKFKSAANGQEKIHHNLFVNEKWLTAVMRFHRIKV